MPLPSHSLQPEGNTWLDYCSTMLIPPPKLERYWGLHPDLILHIGAHLAEEREAYERMAWGSTRVIWVEAMPESAAILREQFKGQAQHELVEALAWDVSGETVTFSIANNGESSSALAMKDHLVQYPHIVVESRLEMTTTALADILDFEDLGRIDLVNLDIQGAELRALQGLEPQLWRVDAIFSEVNKRELYAGGALLPEMDEWLGARGFTRVDWEMLPAGWGDALWLRDGARPTGARVRRFARRLPETPSRLDRFARRMGRRVFPARTQA